MGHNDTAQCFSFINTLTEAETPSGDLSQSQARLSVCTSNTVRREGRQAAMLEKQQEPPVESRLEEGLALLMSPRF